MKIKAIIFGSTGMIGKAVLLECLENNEVKSVLVINRNSCKVNHPKLKEIIHSDFYNLSAIEKEIAVYNTCFYCLGVSSAGLSEAEYYKITFDLTLSIAKTLHTINNEFSFCYISGSGADSTEKGKIMWARVKGKIENALLAMPFKNAYMFRPGYIQPMNGIKSKTKLYNMMYFVMKPFYFLLKHSEKYVTNTQTLSKAMILSVSKGYEKNIMESIDINKIVKEY